MDTPSASGKGQVILRCLSCGVAVWSHYAGASEKARFVRVGTLDDPNACPPDVHIFTGTKQGWVMLPEGLPRFEEYYSGEDVPGIYGEVGAARWAALRGR